MRYLVTFFTLFSLFAISQAVKAREDSDVPRNFGLKRPSSQKADKNEVLRPSGTLSYSVGGEAGENVTYYIDDSHHKTSTIIRKHVQWTKPKGGKKSTSTSHEEFDVPHKQARAKLKELKDADRKKLEKSKEKARTRLKAKEDAKSKKAKAKKNKKKRKNKKKLKKK